MQCALAKVVARFARRTPRTTRDQPDRSYSGLQIANKCLPGLIPPTLAALIAEEGGSSSVSLSLSRSRAFSKPCGPALTAALKCPKSSVN